MKTCASQTFNFACSDFIVCFGIKSFSWKLIKFVQTCCRCQKIYVHLQQKFNFILCIFCLAKYNSPQMNQTVKMMNKPHRFCLWILFACNLFLALKLKVAAEIHQACVHMNIWQISNRSEFITKFISPAEEKQTLRGTLWQNLFCQISLFPFVCASGNPNIPQYQLNIIHFAGVILSVNQATAVRHWKWRNKDAAPVCSSVWPGGIWPAGFSCWRYLIISNCIFLV